MDDVAGVQKQTLGTKIFAEQEKDKIAWADPLMIVAAADQYKKSQRFALPTLFVLAFGFLLLGHHFYAKTEAFLERASRTDGLVVELKEVESTDGDSTWAPLSRSTTLRAGNSDLWKASVQIRRVIIVVRW